MKDTLSRTIIRTAMVTLFAAVVTFSYGTALLGALFPQTMADLSDMLGASNAAAMYYERIYLRTQKTADLYLVLDRYASAENYDKVIKYMPEFYSEARLGERENIIFEINQSGKSYSINAEEYVILCNEDNRLRYVHMHAMLMRGDISGAAAVYAAAIDERMEVFTAAELSRPLHAYFAFVAAGVEAEKLVRADAVRYFKEFRSQYDTYESTRDKYEKLMALDFIVAFASYFDGRGQISELDMTGTDRITYAGKYQEAVQGFVPQPTD
jgi:hypothetical protein